MEGLIFDVQRFSVHDGPGIRSTVFFKGCPLRCAWCHNPESLRPHPELDFDARRCRTTGDCLASCPAGALRAGSDRVVRERCDACGQCVASCPFGALRLVGRTVTVDALVAEILRDRAFYQSSGGGVTFSGGEPTRQLAFLQAVATRCRDEGVGVTLQTCGLFAWDSFAPLLPLFELIHFDLKLLDDDEHRRHTGASNRVILANARRLVEHGAPVTFRMPVVPGITDSEHNLGLAADFLAGLGVGTMRLLRYHAMGQAKLERLDYPIRPLVLADGADPDVSLATAAESLTAQGIHVAVH